MQQNAYLLAKIGADTAENERNFANNYPLPVVREIHEDGRAEATGNPPGRAPSPAAARTSRGEGACDFEVDFCPTASFLAQIGRSLRIAICFSDTTFRMINFRFRIETLEYSPVQLRSRLRCG